MQKTAKWLTVIQLSKHDVIDMAQHFEEDGVEAIIYTDISRDGMMSGVNVEATANWRAIRFRLSLPAALIWTTSGSALSQRRHYGRDHRPGDLRRHAGFEEAEN
jgi:imidazole glycerol phosphate synthase subunit HisF